MLKSLLSIAALTAAATVAAPAAASASPAQVTATTAGRSMLLAPLAHRRRGCLLFRLSSQTIAALVARAAGYLQDARQAREGLGRWTRPLTYTAWRSQGQGASQRFDTRSDDGRAALCLLPAAACAVYVWDDRGLQHTDLFPAPR